MGRATLYNPAITLTDMHVSNAGWGPHVLQAGLQMGVSKMSQKYFPKKKMSITKHR